MSVARVFILSKGKERKRKKEENLSACSEFKEYARSDVHRSTPSGEASALVRVLNVRKGSAKKLFL